MNAIIFDTETTGKPLDYQAKMSDLNNWPRITQLAWQKVDIETGEVLNEYQSLIKPDGWAIPKEKFFIDNNMSTERCEADGIGIHKVLSLLISDINDSSFIVAHNMNFDLNVCGAEMIRLKLKSDKILRKICTMELSTQYCKLKGGKNGFKWPKLTELHKKLFKSDFDGAHDALFDVRACTKCFLQLVKLNIIKL
jgi:DNA polymerase III epsilon subunit-like protein